MYLSLSTEEFRALNKALATPLTPVNITNLDGTQMLLWHSVKTRHEGMICELIQHFDVWVITFREARDAE